MANLKDIRNRIKSVTSIQQVTKAMKMVAATKMRRAQKNMEQARPYTQQLSEMLDSLILEIDRNMLPELQTRETIQRKLFVVITADRGMAAAFNTNVTKVAQKTIDEFSRKNKTDISKLKDEQVKSQAELEHATTDMQNMTNKIDTFYKPKIRELEGKVAELQKLIPEDSKTIQKK